MPPLRVYRSLAGVGSDFGPSALTIGNFDGLHSGHREIMRRVVAIALANRWKPSVLTFDPHPAKVVAPGRAPRLLTTPEQRAALMAQEGIEQVLILPFDTVLSQMTAEQFLGDIVVGRLGARAVLVGDNFHFGRGQEGNTRRLREMGEAFGFLTEIIPAVRRRGRIVSSSEVRRAIAAGDVSRANRMLERPWALEGSVVPGRGVGSKQTVPTLNLATSAEIVPAVGVYITRTEDLEGCRRWPSVTNVGYRPTFGDGSDLSIETFLLAPLDGDPPSRIRVDFCRRIRDERRFPTPEALRAQILLDVSRAQAWFRRLDAWSRGPARVP